MNYLYLPFIIQGLLMGVDEYLHKKRGLGLWERLGHPLDSFTVLAPVTFVAFTDATPENSSIFIVLSVFSCLFITKDEFIHAKECSGLEQWLHSLLFVLHPMIFLCTGVLWKFNPHNEFLIYQPMVVGVFMIYQILRWSIPWKKILR